MEDEKLYWFISLHPQPLLYICVRPQPFLYICFCPQLRHTTVDAYVNLENTMIYPY